MRLHIDAQMPCLTQRRDLHVAQQMFRFVNKDCPKSCLDLFEPLNVNCIRATRSESEDLLLVQKRRLVTTERGIRYFGVVVWNAIPNDIRKAPTQQYFKVQLMKYWQIWDDSILLYICT